MIALLWFSILVYYNAMLTANAKNEKGKDGSADEVDGN
jgi:hypothetical protein